MTINKYELQPRLCGSVPIALISADMGPDTWNARADTRPRSVAGHADRHRTLNMITYDRQTARSHARHRRQNHHQNFSAFEGR